MKIVYMGTPEFAVAPLEALIAAGHEIRAVVTQPDKPKGRSGKVQMPPVKECAIKHGIEVFQPVRIKAPEAVAQLKTYEADAYVVAAFGQPGLRARKLGDLKRGNTDRRDDHAAGRRHRHRGYAGKKDG